MRTRVKICGITRVADLQGAVEAGADAIGLVFYPPSPRSVSLPQAAAVAGACPPMVTRVGLFVDPAPEQVERTLSEVDLDVLQFHGSESPEICASFGRRWIKALRVRDDMDVTAQCRRFAGAGALLLDAWVSDKPGGSGRRFAWERVPAKREARIVLAGGLDPGNVFDAVRTVRPYAVDVSSGVESAPGIKDPGRIRAFVSAVRDADLSLAGPHPAHAAATAQTAGGDGVPGR